MKLEVGLLKRSEEVLVLALGKKLSRISLKVDKGDRVRLGKDKWCNESPLCELCPNLTPQLAQKRQECWRFGGTKIKEEGGIPI